MALTVWESTEYWATGQVPQPLGSANRMSAPYQALATRNGYITIGANNDRLWRRLCTALDVVELLDDDLLGDALVPAPQVHRAVLAVRDHQRGHARVVLGQFGLGDPVVPVDGAGLAAEAGMPLVGLEHGARLAVVEHDGPEATLGDVGGECDAIVASAVKVVAFAVAHRVDVLRADAGEAHAHRRRDAGGHIEEVGAGVELAGTVARGRRDRGPRR